MSGIEKVAVALQPYGLCVVGGFAPEPGDGAPAGIRTLLLIGADGERMWRAFDGAREAHDGASDPLDRWSRRVLECVAASLGATTLFPFGGPPYQPFLRWAERGEGMRASPVSMPVSPSRGLWASYRGALGLADAIDVLPRSFKDPCLGCPAPCETACPVGALSADAPYDVPACVAHIGSAAGAACLDGCLVRRACPVGVQPPGDQRRFHMAAFLASNAARATRQEGN